MTRFQDALRSSIERSDEPREPLWTVISSSAQQARAAGISVERLIVDMKSVWDSVLHERGGVTDAAIQRLKQDIVTRAIKAYYMQ